METFPELSNARKPVFRDDTLEKLNKLVLDSDTDNIRMVNNNDPIRKLKEVLPADMVDKMSKLISTKILSKIVDNGGVDDEIAEELIDTGLSPEFVTKLEDIDLSDINYS